MTNAVCFLSYVEFRGEEKDMKVKKLRNEKGEKREREYERIRGWI